MSDPDWATDVALQVVIVAYTSKNAREIIAEIVRMTYARGEQAGLDQAQKILREAFALPPPETQPGRTP